MNNLANNIIKKIKDGEVNMQPRWHFVLKASLMMVGSVLVAFVAVYLFSFVLFTLHQNGLWFAPQFGFKGMMMFVQGTPWLLLSILGIFLLLLYVLVSQYSFSYRKPVVYSLVVVVLLVISLSSVIQYFGVHNRVQLFAERNNVPGLRPLYQNRESSQPAGVVVGVISNVSGDDIQLKTENGEILQLLVTTDTKLPPDIILKTGLEVIVFGDRDGNSVTAFGIKPASEKGFRALRFNKKPEHQIKTSDQRQMQNNYKE